MKKQVKIDGDGIIHIQNDADAPKCPFCGSTDTEMLDKPPNVSYYCNACEKNWEPNKDAEDMQDEEKSDGETEDSEMEDKESEDEEPPKEKMDSITHDGIILASQSFQYDWDSCADDCKKIAQFLSQTASKLNQLGMKLTRQQSIIDKYDDEDKEWIEAQDEAQEIGGEISVLMDQVAENAKELSDRATGN